MVSKVFSGHSFYHACRYIVNKPGAEVLACEGVRGHDYKVMSDDFILQQQLRPQKEKACFHCSLSFYPGEKLSDEQMVKIAMEYLMKMKIVDTQYAITKHTDRKHVHLHVVANMVDNTGKAISDSYLGLRGKKIAQRLTQLHKLVPALKKNLELSNYETLHMSEANKYKVYEAILHALPQCKTLDELEKKLKPQGIEVQYKYKGQTEEKQGVSFKLGDYSFKGSQVDRQFSLGHLEKTLKETKEQILGNENRISHGTLVFTQNQTREWKSDGDLERNLGTDELAKGLEKAVKALLKPEEKYEQTPSEMLQESQRKRKKQSQNQGNGFHH